ncbi:hypothetical protein [Vibrio anguillarum]|uniref:hypothetical protein n=1 Tax=Vibrio anguillarum TaxID=55601 RepID=UPI00037AE2A1|nr:hypothetical protein [Vibrio anguillarum]OEE48881.1 hypothetical protein A1QU_13275 [Vibrio anguillarum]
MLTVQHKQLRDVTRLLLSGFYARNAVTIADLKNELLNNPVHHVETTSINVTLTTNPKLTLTTQAMLDSKGHVLFDVQIKGANEFIDFLYFVEPSSVSNAKYAPRRQTPILITQHSSNAKLIFCTLPVRQTKM